MSSQKQMLQDIEREVDSTRYMIGRSALSQQVMDALLAVPRDAFVPLSERRCAYYNGPLPIGCGQTISQPYIVALMTDLLCADSNDVILEVGTGSGYQAAVLSRVVRQVYSVEIIETLSQRALETLSRLGYENVDCRCGDGYLGWPEHAPYDGILVTAACPEIPPPLISQLKSGARMVIPVGPSFGYQELVLVDKHDTGEVSERKILDVSFVPLTGNHERGTY